VRYKARGLEIRAENTAKPINQASSYLRQWLMEMPRVGDALDYGCGKLRYALTLAQKADALVLVDSEIQLSRRQVIAGRSTSVREYSTSRWKHVGVLNADEFEYARARFDFALCANVLSAVPSPRERERIITAIGSHLRSSGQALFAVQYRNSHFRDWQYDPTASRYRDGWLVSNGRGTSFYAIIPLPRLVSHVESGGMRVFEAWTRGESAYVLAKRD
jgi:SAM-dependent methyltransferase